MIFEKITEAILKTVYPPRCTFCRTILKSDGICDKCAKTLPYVKRQSASAPPFVDKVYAPFYYRDAVRRAIRRYKFNRMAAYAKPFAEIMEECIRAHLKDEVDFITWVPISAKRLRTRGYDQSQLIAERLAKALNLPMVSTMIKIRDNKSQSKIKSEAERRANVIGVYAIENYDAIPGKRILLIDDVLTTGATTSECARVLKCAGAERIYLAVVAKTVKKRIEKRKKWFII